MLHFSNFIRELIMTYQLNNFNPNLAQEKAITHPLAPLMILAGAGTGKTTTLIHRIVHMVENKNVEPSSILTITYTEKAAMELKKRIYELIGSNAEKMMITTFHGFCYGLVKELSPNAQNINLITEEELAFLLLKKFDDLGPFQSREFKKNPVQSIMDSFIPFFNRVRDELISIEDIMPGHEIENESEQAAQINDLTRIFPIFQSLKKKANLMDYGDMILSAYRMLNKSKTALHSIQVKYQNLIIDEFQDNNHALNAISSLIAKKRKSITVVGDEDQVIYSFRGASIHNVKQFRKLYHKEDHYLEIALEENYRSPQEILDLANASIQNNTERIEKKLFSALGYVNELPKVIYGEKPQQNQFILDEITKITAGGRKNNEIAILCRTNGQAKEIATFLKLYGIPVKERFPKFFELKIVQELYAWCLVVGGGQNKDIAFFKLLEKYTSTNFASNYFKEFEYKDKNSRLDHALKDNEALSPNFKKLCQTIVGLKNYSYPSNFKFARTAEESLNEIIKKTGILYPLNNRYNFDDKVNILNAGVFIKKTQDFVLKNPKKNSLIDFNIFFESILSLSKQNATMPKNISQFNCINIDTIHGSKGGEFPIVFIPYNRTASFPLNLSNKKTINNPPEEWLSYTLSSVLTNKEFHIEEERRLFYVSITRAKEKLYLLAPNRATSPFIKELSKDIVEKKEIIMNSNLTTKPYSKLRVQYEQLLQNSISRNEFNHASNYLKTIKRINDMEKGVEIDWGNDNWEQELQKEVELETYVSESLKEIKLSASSIQQYETCPLKYRFSKIDFIPQSSGKPALVFGNIIHRTLQKFHSPRQEKSKKNLLKILHQEWESEGFFYKEQEKEFLLQAKEMLDRYFDQEQITSNDIIAREKSFSFFIDEIKISGAIDRIDRTDSGIHVIDYKTNNAPSSAKGNMQLAIYSMYLESCDDKDIKGLPEKASLYFLRQEEKPIRSYSFSKEELDEKKNFIKNVANDIKQQRFQPKTGKHCDWCDYKNFICPSWQNERK